MLNMSLVRHSVTNMHYNLSTHYSTHT